MSINARCGSCSRELLLGQLVQPRDGFRCPFCGFAFAPAYATVAPDVAAQVMAAQATLVTALTELQSMTGDRLRLDQATVIDPVANALPQAEAQQPGLSRRGRARWWARGAAASPPNRPARLNRQRREPSALSGVPCPALWHGGSRCRMTSTGRPPLLRAAVTCPPRPHA